MKISVTKTTKTKETIDVEFPVYREASDSFDSGGWYECRMELHADGTVKSVTEHADRWEFEIKNYGPAGLGPFFGDDRTYYRDSTREECEEMVAKAIAALDGLRVGA